MKFGFEWDPGKATANYRKHGVSFDEASETIDDPLSITVPDSSSSWDEDRFRTVGRTQSGRLLVVVHSIRGDNMRIISARLANREERSLYEEAD